MVTGRRGSSGAPGCHRAGGEKVSGTDSNFAKLKKMVPDTFSVSQVFGLPASVAQEATFQPAAVAGQIGPATVVYAGDSADSVDANSQAVLQTYASGASDSSTSSTDGGSSSVDVVSANTSVTAAVGSTVAASAADSQGASESPAEPAAGQGASGNATFVNSTVIATESIDFSKYPADKMRDLISTGFARRSSDGKYVVVVGANGDQVEDYVYVAHYPSVYAGFTTMQGSVPDYYTLVLQGTDGLIGNNGLMEGSQTTVTDFVATLQTQEYTDRFASLAAGKQAVAAGNTLVATLQFSLATVKIGASFVPGGAAVGYGMEGNYKEMTVSLAGDAACLLTGPLAAAAKAKKAYALAKAAYYTAAADQAAIGSYRLYQGVYELRNPDGSNVAAGCYIGESILRMFGATNAVINGINASRLSVAARSASATIGSIVKNSGVSISDDTLVNFGSVSRAEIAPSTGARSYWFRYGDIKNLTDKQLQTVIGDLASAGQPGGANVMRATSMSATSFTKLPPNNAAGIAEYVIDVAVHDEPS